MDEKKTELLQKIGSEVCEDCGPERDCGLEVDECFRMINAERLLNEYVEFILK